MLKKCAGVETSCCCSSVKKRSYFDLSGVPMCASIFQRFHVPMPRWFCFFIFRANARGRIKNIQWIQKPNTLTKGFRSSIRCWNVPIRWFAVIILHTYLCLRLLKRRPKRSIFLFGAHELSTLRLIFGRMCTIMYSPHQVNRFLFTVLISCNF